MIKNIISCMQLRSLPLGMATVMAGCAAATIHGNFEVLPAILSLLFVIFAQLSANLYHRYCDAKFSFGENIDMGIVDNGSIPLAAALRETMLGATMIAVLLGIGIMTMTGWWVILLGIAMYTVSYFNSAGPYPLSRSPWGLLPAFLFFGPIGVIATCFIQAQYDGVIDHYWDLRPALFLSCAIGLFAVNSQLYYNYMSRGRDINNGKHTIATDGGLRLTRWLFLINNLIIYGISFVLVFINHLPHAWGIMIIPFACVCIGIFLWIQMLRNNHKYLIAMGWVNNVCALFYSLSAFIIFYYLGLPDESALRMF